MDAADRAMAAGHYRKSKTWWEQLSDFGLGTLGCLLFGLAITPIPAMFVAFGLRGFGVAFPLNAYIGLAVQLALIVYVGLQFKFRE
jgi:hypothetical protein